MADYQNDERVLLALKAGNEDQLATLYHSYKDSFLAFIVKMFQCDPTRAADIYPECMSEMYFNIRKGKLEAPLRSSLKTYLFTIGKFVYNRRYLDKFHRSTNSYDDVVSINDTYVHGDENMMKKERAKVVQSILGSLADPCRTLLEKMYFSQFSFDALANHFGISEGAVRKRKFDCLKKFRKILTEQNIEL